MERDKTNLELSVYTEHLGQVLAKFPTEGLLSVRLHTPDALGWCFYSAVDYTKSFCDYPLLVLPGTYRPIKGGLRPSRMGRPMYALSYLVYIGIHGLAQRKQITDGSRFTDQFGNCFEAREMHIPRQAPILALLPQNWSRPHTQAIYSRCGYIKAKLKD